MKKRVGNDIKQIWTILRNENAEDFSDATNIVITASIPNTCNIIICAYTRTLNVFNITITASNLTVGTYDYKITYNKPDETIEGDLATYTIDSTAAFQIVKNTEDEDSEGSELVGTVTDFNIVQATGQSTISVMSQKAVTDNLFLKVDKVTGKDLSTNDFTNTLKNKLDGIAESANNYTHPTNHPASIITQDVSNRFVSDTEKSTWNGKQPALNGTGFVKISGTTISYDNNTYSTDIHSNISALNSVSGSNTGDQSSDDFDIKDLTDSTSLRSTWSAKQDALTFGIANTNKVKIDSTTVATGEYAKFTANGLESRSTSEVLSDIGAQASLGYTAENAANKSNDIATDAASTTKYASVKAFKDYADSLVAGLLDYMGGYNASGNTYPTTGGSGLSGAVMKGDMWIISVAGTLGGEAVQIGDSIIANVDTPAQTAGNWNHLNANISYVPEDAANKVTSISSGSTDVQYASAKLLYDQLAGKISNYGSTTAKHFLAAPNAADGTPSFRAIVASDIPALSYAAPLSGTINEIAYFNSASTIASLAVATYPSLTELAFVKGVTSAIQTQLGTMLLKSGGTMTGSITSTAVVNPLITAAESWIGSSATAGVYFKGGNVGIGTTAPSRKLEVSGISTGNGSQILDSVAIFTDTSSMAAGVGGGISFSGNYSGTTNTTAAGIKALKTNGTAGDYSFDLGFYTRNTGTGDIGEAMRINNLGNVGFGTIAPTAVIHTKAGTAAAGTAPRKYTSGALMTVAEVGAIEFLTDTWYGTITTGAARRAFQFKPINDEWITALDYAGNVANLLKLSKDNIIEFGQPVGIASLYHVLNAGVNDIVNIPVSALSADNTEHGVGVTVGGTRILKVSALSDGAGGVDNKEVHVDAAFYLDTPVYDDIIIQASNLRGGSSAPSFVAFQDSVYQSCFLNANTDVVYGAFEIPHTYKEGTALEIHIHWSPSSTDTGNCVFNFNYTIAGMNGTFGNEVPLTITQAGSGVAKKHQYASASATITGSLTIGTIIAFSLTRPTGDAFSGDAFLHSVGCHYQVDTLGSRQMGVK